MSDAKEVREEGRGGCCNGLALARILGIVAFAMMFVSVIANILECNLFITLYTLLFAFLVCALEMPTCLRVCETEKLQKSCERFTNLTQLVKGISRAILYAAGTLPFFFCVHLSTMLAVVALLGSAFFYGKDWRDSKKGQPVPTTEGREDLLSDAERGEIDNDGGEQPNMWNRFVNSAVDTASNAIAAATVKKVKEDMGLPTSASSDTASSNSRDKSNGSVAGNPFASSSASASQKAAPDLNFVIDDDENPFAASNPNNTGIPTVTPVEDIESDAEGNPFAAAPGNATPFAAEPGTGDEDNPFAQ